MEGGRENTIGPGNVIAYNGRAGVLLAWVQTNVVTGNSIHDNDGPGIHSHGNVVPPRTLRLELDTGVLLGNTCVGCTVEIFSDKEDEGEVLEGVTIADNQGVFNFEKGSPFLGPHVTMTATDPHGNTSSFSQAISDQQQAFQAANTNGLRSLSPSESIASQDNRIGSGASLADGVFSQMEAEWCVVPLHLDLGVTWSRMSVDFFDWWEVAESGRFSKDYVDPNHDLVINRLVENGIRVMLILVFWDERIQVAAPPERRFTSEEEIEAYGEYVQSIVSHFKGRVYSYELLNEPNNHEPGQYVSVDDYLNLVRYTVPVIREVDPTARIVIGAVTPPDHSYDYLSAIVHSDVMPLIDGISWHVNNESPEYLREYYYQYPHIVRTISDTAHANGFVGDFIVEELHWRTPTTPHPTEYCEYRELPAAKYHARGILMNLGLGSLVQVSPEGLGELPHLINAWRNLCAVMAGHEAIDMPVEIDIETNGPVAYCAFRYPDGDRMLAVWTDGIAQDEDPSVPATITFPGLAAKTVTGIDVLHGFEQELVFETDEDSIIIRDLLVKDYPILLRLSDVTMNPDYVETVGDGFHRLGDVDFAPSSGSSGKDRDGDGVPDDEDFCPDWPGSKESNGC